MIYVFITKIIIRTDVRHRTGYTALVSLLSIKLKAMKEINIRAVPTGTYEIAAWLVMLMVMLFGYRYIKEIAEYVLIKLYEFFIQHKQFPV